MWKHLVIDVFCLEYISELLISLFFVFGFFLGWNEIESNGNFADYLADYISPR
jgi:hypothetical protein